MSPRIEAIRDAVEKMHGCKAVHVSSVPTREMLGAKVVWEGVVEIFDLTGHPKAKRCYAWQWNPDGKELRFVGVLEIPPVKDPLTAFRAAFMAYTKPRIMARVKELEAESRTKPA